MLLQWNVLALRRQTSFSGNRRLCKPQGCMLILNAQSLPKCKSFRNRLVPTFFQGKSTHKLTKTFKTLCPKNSWHNSTTAAIFNWDVYTCLPHAPSRSLMYPWWCPTYGRYLQPPRQWGKPQMGSEIVWFRRHFPHQNDLFGVFPPFSTPKPVGLHFDLRKIIFKTKPQWVHRLRRLWFRAHLATPSIFQGRWSWQSERKIVPKMESKYLTIIFT